MTTPQQQLKKQNSINQTTSTYQNKKYTENATKMKQQHNNHNLLSTNNSSINSPISNTLNNPPSTNPTTNLHPNVPNGQTITKGKDKNAYSNLSNNKYSTKKSSFNNQPSKPKTSPTFNTDKPMNNPKSPTNTFTFTFANKFKEEAKDDTNQLEIEQQKQQEMNSVIKEENEQTSLEEGDKKLRETIQLYSTVIRKNEGAGINTLLKVRSVLLNWLKDSDQDNEYNKFITEKKIKYLLKNKEKNEARIKTLEQELVYIAEKKKEVEKTLGEMYVNYEEDELKADIIRFENSYEVKSGKNLRTLEKLEEMKQMIPFVIENNKLKDSETSKLNDKKELEKIQKGSNLTLISLTCYYKNRIKKSTNEINGSS